MATLDNDAPDTTTNQDLRKGGNRPPAIGEKPTA